MCAAPSTQERIRRTPASSCGMRSAPPAGARSRSAGWPAPITLEEWAALLDDMEAS